MASYPYPEHEGDDIYYDEGEEQLDGDDNNHEDYEYWSLYSDDEEEERDEDEDEDEVIPLIGDEDGDDVDNENVDGDEEEYEEEQEEEACMMEIDGGELGAESAAELDRSDSSSCPICFSPWTADGPHRVCCPPCGHVHGRSCLETWLQRCGETNGKCPQCNRKFGHLEIINLYAPQIVFPSDSLDKARVHELSSWKCKGSTSHLFTSNLGEVRRGCAHCTELQERVMNMEAHMSRLGNLQVQNSQLIDFQNEVANLRYEVIELKTEMTEMRSEMDEVAELQDEVARLKNKVTEMRSQVIDVVGLQEETDNLKSKMAEMSSEMIEMRRMFAEMTRMQSEMQFAKKRHLPMRAVEHPTNAGSGASCAERSH